jgi:tetratricopeptide (TPR) repeat protein
MASPTTPAASSVRETIKVFDEYGRTLEVEKETWRTQVLPANLAATRNDPDALYSLIVNALHSGFAADVLESARHLATIDPQKLRSATLLGIVWLQLGKPDEAKRVLESALARYGEEGSLLTNLAKAHAALGDPSKRDETLWCALQLDPNQSNGLMWFLALARDQGGSAAQTAALERVAALPGSWHAQLWLARAALERNETERAVQLYRDALSRIDPIPADALMQISGDLGSRGQLALLLELCAPRFDGKLHGIQVGNNLIKAHLDLGRPAEARQLLERLYAEQRPDWHEALLAWELRIDEAERRYGPLTGPIELQLITLDRPLWGDGRLGFEALLPAKDSAAFHAMLLMGTGQLPGPAETQPRLEQTNALGHVTRTIPLFLAEAIHLRTTARASTTLAISPRIGLLLPGTPWDLEALKKSGLTADLLVLLNVDARAVPWTLQFSAYHWPHGARLSNWEIPFALEQPLAALNAARERLLEAIHTLPSIKAAAIAPVLADPSDNQLPLYVRCLEDALLFALVARAPTDASATPAPGQAQPDGGLMRLWGDRALIDRLLHLAVSTPQSARSRFLLLNSLEKEARRRPDIVREYLPRLDLLQQRNPLPAGAAADLARAALATLRAALRGN